MNRSQKEALVEGLRDKMSRASFTAAISFEKLDAQTAIDLRKVMRDNNIDYKVVKNTLALIAAEGTAVEQIKEEFSGPVALAFAYDDVVSPAKVISEFFKTADKKLSIKRAVVEGSVVSAEQVDALAKMPGLPELRATLLALVNTPATTLARLINTPATQVARVVQAHVDAQNEAA